MILRQACPEYLLYDDISIGLGAPLVRPAADFQDHGSEMPVFGMYDP
jgi:hypothetical protein